jgi:hypothetical protein
MHFPDEYFPIQKELEKDFISKVETGKTDAKNLKVLFCATCKDVALHIRRTLNLVIETGEMFGEYDIFLYENNSKDETVEIIQKEYSDKVILNTEVLPDSSYNRSEISFYERCQFIARARNNYVDYINQNSHKYDYVFVFDTDLEGGWSKDGILNSIYYLQNDRYDCMTSYCIVSGYENKPLEDTHFFGWLMFDSYAFRFKDTQGFPTDLLSYNKIKCEKGSPPIEVDSNFNGLAIYKPYCFKDVFYSVLNYDQDWATDIDHVTIHAMMRNKGINIYLNPSMITCVSKHKYSEDY